MTASKLQTERTAFVVKAGDDHIGGPLRVGDGEIIVKISSGDTGGAYTVFEGHTPPLAGPPLHIHYDQDESWYIVSGHYRFEVDGETIVAGPGDTVFAPRGSRHTFQNIGKETGTTITTVVPGGLDLFFQEVSAAGPQGSAPDMTAVLPLFDKYNLRLVGPPLAERDRGR